MTTTAHINPRMLRWAMNRGGFDSAELAVAMKKTAELIDAWRDGTAFPTVRQAQDLSRRVHVPFGYLFLGEPPADDVPIPDFRTRAQNWAVSEASLDLREVIGDVLRKQEWYREYRRSRDEEPIEFVGSFTVDDDVEVVAAAMSQQLDFANRVRPESQMDGFLRQFARQAETSGVLVMRSGIVKQNTHRPLDASEFQGFAISDPFAPAVFVNGNDAPAAQIFTLAHELAHIWVGQTGISDAGLSNTDRNNSVETFCNRAAGELLVPWQQVRRLWTEDPDVASWTRTISRRFHVSTVMAARQLWTHQEISADAYFAFYHQEAANWTTDRPGSSGGNYYATSGVRNSRLLAESVIESMNASRTTVREASRLLGVKPVNLERLLQTVGSE